HAHSTLAELRQQLIMGNRFGHGWRNLTRAACRVQRATCTRATCREDVDGSRATGYGPRATGHVCCQRNGRKEWGGRTWAGEPTRRPTRAHVRAGVTPSARRLALGRRRGPVRRLARDRPGSPGLSCSTA